MALTPEQLSALYSGQASGNMAGFNGLTGGMSQQERNQWINQYGVGGSSYDPTKIAQANRANGGANAAAVSDPNSQYYVPDAIRNMAGWVNPYAGATGPDTSGGAAGASTGWSGTNAGGDFAGGTAAAKYTPGTNTLAGGAGSKKPYSETPTGAGTVPLSTLAGGGYGSSGAAGGAASGTSNPMDFFNDAGYKFRLKQGTDAVQNSAAARGGLNSGATLKGIADYSQGLASQEYGAAFDRMTNQRNFDRGVYTDDRNFGRSTYQNDRDFDYGAGRDARDFDYNAARDDRNFNNSNNQWDRQFGYTTAAGDRSFNANILQSLMQGGLSASGDSGRLATVLASILGNNNMTGAGAGANGGMGQANNTSGFLSQLLQMLSSNAARQNNP